jgi:hypothetical protein
MVEAMSLCDMLVVDPCVFVVGTHLHCTLERSYRHDEDWVTRDDVESGRYSIAVRPTSLTLASHRHRRRLSLASSATPTPTSTNHDKASVVVVVGFHGSGDDFIRANFNSVGSVETDTERIVSGIDHDDNCEEHLKAIVIPSLKLPALGDRHFTSLPGLRRTISEKCSKLMLNVLSRPIGHIDSSVRIILVRDPFDTIAQNYIYQKITHRSAHLEPRRERPKPIGDMMQWIAKEYLNTEEGEWKQYALVQAAAWKDFYAPIVLGGNQVESGSRLFVVTYESLLHGKGVEVLRTVFGLNVVQYSHFKSAVSLGHLDKMVHTTAFGNGLKEKITQIVYPILNALRIKTSFDPPSSPIQSAPSKKLIEECGGVGQSSRCVVAFTLYGDDERYTGGVIANARDIYHCNVKEGVLGPSWRMRVYHNSSSPLKVLQALEQLGVELVYVDGKQGQLSNPRAWRFQVAGDDSVQRYLLRDVDSRISSREVAAIHEWVDSGLPFHVMRDHPRSVSPLPPP